MDAKIIGFRDTPKQAQSPLLTDEESQELDRICADDAVIGLHIIGADGEDVESDGVWAETAGPIFTHIMRLAQRIGEEVGETSVAPVVFTENASVEIASISLSRCTAVIIRKRKIAAGGLANVR